MNEWTLIFTVVGVGLAAVVAVLPLYLPKKSCYYRRAQQGIEKLNDFTESKQIGSDDLGFGNQSNEIKFAWLDPGDTGYKQIKKAITEAGTQEPSIWWEGIAGEIERIGFLYGDSHRIAEYFDTEYMKYGTSPNYALFIQYTDGEKSVVSYNREQPRNTQFHLRLERWISVISERRTRAITAFLALLWATVSISSTLEIWSLI